MRILGTIILTVAGGLLIAFAVFMLRGYPFTFFGGPGMVMTQPGHIDFWTGEITPMITSRYDNGQVVDVYLVPEGYKDIRVAPVPVGFVAGSLLTLTVITIVSRRPRRTAPNPVVPAA